ncbi:Myb_DNA-bind_3 domain-containing protein [Cephalotus follicularis]|uniref:Myb_DNA-bind_3 domain-containing protein n=1 Tax=Cephalotus follicularis TaxID=3775 RepID=A0A1Q3D6S0_CEPFO|nr:Myb_DNA-bind_3 domain-containing protein [Cephalotus follicularis]
MPDSNPTLAARYSSRLESHLTRLLHDHSDDKIVKTGEQSKKPNVDKKCSVKWTDYMDDALVDALLNQQNMGNRVDNVFTTAAYDNMVKELREKIGVPVEKNHLKNRIKTVKHNFKECYNHFKGMHGFAWSPETKMWNAEVDVWKSLVKAKPDAKKWMTSPIANYDKLLVLFAKDKEKADGANQKAHLHASPGSGSFHAGNVLQNEVTHNLEDLNDMNGGTSQLVTPVETNSQADDSQVPSLSATSLKSKKRKAQKFNIYEREFQSIREAIKDVADAIREGNKIAERGRPRVHSEQEVFAELMKVGIDAPFRYRAYTFLVASACRVRAFFGCPAEERKEFLMQMIYEPADAKFV